MISKTLFVCHEEACCCWDEKYRMKILCQFLFVCMVHNFICHQFLFLCLQGNSPHSSLLVSGAFYCLLFIFLD